MTTVATADRLPLLNRERCIVPRGRLECEPPVMLGSQMGWLPLPQRRQAAWLNETVLVALSDRDGRWAATCLELAGTRLTRQEQLAGVWLPLIVGAALLQRQGQPLHDMGHALSVLRRLIRENCDAGTPDETTAWVVPASDDDLDRTSAYLTAASLRLRGADSRPWLWAGRPAVGRCIRSGCAPRGHDELLTVSMLPIPGLYHISRLLRPASR